MPSGKNPVFIDLSTAQKQVNQIQHLSWYNFKAGEFIAEQSWYISVGTQCQRQLDVYDCPTTTTDSATVPLFVRLTNRLVPPPPGTWLVYCLGEVSGPQFYTSQSKIWIKWLMLAFHSVDTVGTIDTELTWQAMPLSLGGLLWLWWLMESVNSECRIEKVKVEFSKMSFLLCILLAALVSSAPQVVKLHLCDCWPFWNRHHHGKHVTT